MRKSSFALAAMLLVIVFILAAPELQAGKGKLQVSETAWDWGRAPQNSVLSHSFWIKNVGTDTLRSLNVTVA